MVDQSSTQGTEHWKQKYYDQLDQLEKKEAEWESLELILKKAIGRLSLAAEGHYESVDRHVKDIRAAIKQKINQTKLDLILDDLSKFLLKIEEKNHQPDQQLIQLLDDLLSGLHFPEALNKSKNKLLKSLQKSTDKDIKKLLSKSIELIQASQVQESDGDKAGFIDRLLGKTNKNDGESPSIKFVSDVLQQVVEATPWPEDLLTKKSALAKKIKAADHENDIASALQSLLDLYNQWPDETPHNQQQISLESNDDLEVHRQCFLSLLDQLEDLKVSSGKLSAFKINISNAKGQQELEKLSAGLVQLINDTHPEASTVLIDDDKPTVQELLLRLLEQLIVPTDLQIEVDEMRQRLQEESSVEDWKKLLKDVASLINAIRSRMQEEKTDFEEFLQQITSRLQEMDSFLQTENSALQTANEEGHEFDAKVASHVQIIRDDITQASELSDLKMTVEKRLDTMSEHIQSYRSIEKDRYQAAQKNIDDMQQRMQALESETVNLKQIIVEKNKLALYDALTEIPNRLFYEQKSKEEIARWKRFATPLSLAIWDIDFFKKVNDNYGHKAGDKVLKTVAQLLNKRIRQTDFLARFGGEEFVMLLPGTKEEETLRLVNELREQVAQCGFHFQGEAVPITLSCGVSSFKKEDDTLSAVFERADQALYRAKENGRNQCVVDSCLSD